MENVLTEMERLAIEGWEAKQQLLLIEQQRHEERRTLLLKTLAASRDLPADAIGTTHELKDWAIVPRDEVADANSHP